MMARRFLFLGALLCLLAAGAAAEAPDDATPLDLVVKAEESLPADPPSLLGSLGTMTLSLGLVMGLIGLAAWLARKYLPVQKIGASGRAPIEVIGAKQLGNRQSLMLVRAMGQTFLVGRGPQTMQTLGRLESPDAEANETKATPLVEDTTSRRVSFAAQLRNVEAAEYGE